MEALKPGLILTPTPLFSEEILQIFFTFALSGAAAWGGAKHALKSHEKMINELQKEIKRMVSQEFCRNERVDCRQDKAAAASEFSKRFDEIHEMIAEQDKRRHDANNKMMAAYSDISQKLIELSTKLDERSRIFRRTDQTL